MRYFSVLGYVQNILTLNFYMQNILTLHFYQQFDLMAIIYWRLRAAGVIPSISSRDGEKTAVNLTDHRMEWSSGPNALQKV